MFSPASPMRVVMARQFHSCLGKRGKLRFMQTSAQFFAQPSASGLALVELESPTASTHVVGVSAAWRKLLMQAEMAAPHLQVAAIEGEYGSGKHTLARYLFDRSPLAASFLSAPRRPRVAGH